MLLIHFMVFALALAAPLEKTMPKNLTASSRCTRSQDWQAYAFLVEDCYTAIQRLYIEEVLKKPDAIYEFITVGTYPRTLHPWMRTPIEYTVNSCTLSIVMLNLFGHKESLPGRGAVNFHHSDTASFKDIYRAARLVEKDCLLPDRLPGWEAVGAKSSIGVFLWATDSEINDRVTGKDYVLSSNELTNLISPNASSDIADNMDSTS